MAKNKEWEDKDREKENDMGKEDKGLFDKIVEKLDEDNKLSEEEKKNLKRNLKVAGVVLVAIILILSVYFAIPPTEYHGDASEYVLTEHELDEWTLSETNEPFPDAGQVESSKENTFYRNGDYLIVSVIIFESIEEAENFYEHNKELVDEKTLTIDEDLGCEAFSFMLDDEPYLYIRLSNVFIEVYSDVTYYPIMNVAEQQIDKIEG